MESAGPQSESGRLPAQKIFHRTRRHRRAHNHFHCPGLGPRLRREQRHHHRHRVTGPLTVSFGSTATTFTIDSATQLTAVAPGGTGAVQVTVTGSGGTSNGLTYTYV